MILWRLLLVQSMRLLDHDMDSSSQPLLQWVCGGVREVLRKRSQGLILPFCNQSKIKNRTSYSDVVLDSLSESRRNAL